MNQNENHPSMPKRRPTEEELRRLEAARRAAAQRTQRTNPNQQTNMNVRQGESRQPEQQPVRRNYHRNPKRMTEHLAITSAERVGKAQGFCARNDIERSVARLTGRTREDVREAVNRIASRMQITCVKSRSYRYYPRSQRKAIVDAAIEELERI